MEQQNEGEKYPRECLREIKREKKRKNETEIKREKRRKNETEREKRKKE